MIRAVFLGTISRGGDCASVFLHGRGARGRGVIVGGGEKSHFLEAGVGHGRGDPRDINHSQARWSNMRLGAR